jgi:hypothetical protein
MFWFGFILGVLAGANLGVVVFGALLKSTRANAAFA